MFFKPKFKIESMGNQMLFELGLKGQFELAIPNQQSFLTAPALHFEFVVPAYHTVITISKSFFLRF